MTKKEMFKEINAILLSHATQAAMDGETDEQKETESLMQFIDREIELLDKKYSTPKKPTATQVENENFKSLIIDYLTTEKSEKSIKELQAGIPELANITNQRITHLLTDLVKGNTLTKNYVKKTPYYSVLTA